MKRSELVLGVARIPMDGVMALLGLVVAYSIRAAQETIPGVTPFTTMPTWEEYLVFALVSTVVFLGILAMQGMYSLKTTTKLRQETATILYCSTLWVGAIIGYYFMIRSFFPSRLLLLYGWVFVTTAVFVGRVLIRVLQQWLLAHGYGVQYVAVLGEGPAMEKVSAMLGEHRAYEVIQHYSESELADLEEACAQKHLDMVIQTTPLSTEQLTRLMDMCYEHHIRFRFLPDILSVRWLALETVEEEGIPLLEVKPSPLDGWGRVMKRAMDIVGALVGIVLFTPLWIGTAVAVWIQMGKFREILFRQKRYGQGAKLFLFNKFQSMYVGAEKEHTTLMKAQQGERKGLLKIEKDPRVTPVGRVIRKTSLDELPQLWNVLKGDMSLVGPRPHMPAEVDVVKKTYSPILHMKPGITGLPQVQGRSALSFDDEMALDLYYLKHWSLWLDITIIIRTIGVVLLRKNAS